MNKCIKYILIFAIIASLMLCPFSGCFGIFAEATYGTMWAIASSSGVSISSTGVAVGSSEWSDFNDNLWGDLDIGNMKYLETEGSITVCAEDYNAVLDRLASRWGDTDEFRPTVLNKRNVYVDKLGQRFYDWLGYSPSDVGYSATFRRGMNSDLLPKFVFTDGSFVRVLSRSNVFSVQYCAADGSVISSSSTETWYTDRDFYISLGLSNATSEFCVLVSTAFGNNYTAKLRLLALGNFDSVSGGVTSAVLSVPSVAIEIDGIQNIVEGAAAIAARKVQEPSGKTVTITPILPNGQKQLQGLPWIDVDRALEEGFFDTVHDVVQAVIGDGVLNPTDDEDTTDLIYGEVSWIRRILQKIDTTLDSIKTAVVSLVNGNGDSPPPAIMQPPEWLGGGDGGLGAHIGGIWHYVLSWVGSMSSGLALIASVWSGLPPAMTAAIWGSAVVVIVVGLFKRYVA